MYYYNRPTASKNRSKLYSHTLYATIVPDVNNDRLRTVSRNHPVAIGRRVTPLSTPSSPNVDLIFPRSQPFLRRHRHCRCRHRVLRSTVTLRSSLYAFSGQDPRTVFHDVRLLHPCTVTAVYSWSNVVTVLIEKEGPRPPI